MNSGDAGNLELLKVVPAWLALVLSALSLLVSVQSLRIARRKDERASPQMSFYLESGVITTLDDRSRLYRFALSLTNRSDLASSLVNVEGLLRGVTATGVDMSIRIPRAPMADDEEGPFRAGAKIGAGETLTGAVGFAVTPHVLQGLRRIDRFLVVVTDGYGEQHVLDPGVLKEVSS